MWTPLALALLCVSAEPKTPEIVALPLSTSDDKASQGLEAWKIVADGLAKAKKKLKLGINLQKKHNDFLVGPVREQARDCGDDLGCLAEIGTALGADLLVSGKIDEGGVSLRVIDVAAKSIWVDARSPDGLKKADAKKQAQTAVKLLINALAEQQKKKPAKGEGPGAVAGVTGGAPGTGGQDSGMTGGAPVMKNGRIQIAKDQLASVKKLTIDGELVSFSGDGSASWSGPPGSHRVVAERTDGQRISKEVALDPDRTMNVTLEFAAIAQATPAAASTQAKREPEGDSVTGKWWFWTSVGLAVVGGTATAILLAGGGKGGPELPDDTGTIRGTY